MSLKQSICQLFGPCLEDPTTTKGEEAKKYQKESGGKLIDQSSQLLWETKAQFTMVHHSLPASDPWENPWGRLLSGLLAGTLLCQNSWPALPTWTALNFLDGTPVEMGTRPSYSSNPAPCDFFLLLVFVMYATKAVDGEVRECSHWGMVQGRCREPSIKRATCRVSVSSALWSLELHQTWHAGSGKLGWPGTSLMRSQLASPREHRLLHLPAWPSGAMPKDWNTASKCPNVQLKTLLLTVPATFFNPVSIELLWKSFF